MSARPPHLFYCLILLACLWSAEALAQQGPAISPDSLWRAVEPSRVATMSAGDPSSDEVWEGPPNFRLYSLDPVRLGAVLDRAAARPGPAAVGESVEPAQITIPMPDGTYARFWIEESQILAPELAAKFPDIRTFRGQGIDDPQATLQIDFSQDGFHAQILSSKGVVIVDPFRLSEHVYAAYDKMSVTSPSPFDCDVRRRGESQPPARREAARTEAPLSGVLRTYRLAVATTGEYTAEHGGDVAGALRGITRTVTRVSGIYEKELAIQLQLVAHNDRLIFTDPATDPFTNDNPHQLILESQAEIDRLIGNAGYDIGHTFSTGAGGLASLGVVCRAGEKASGVTGTDRPFGDAFDVDFVAHEMGHQFGADHTFNGALGHCTDNRNAPTAFEPGSGSTIQAYAGICEADNLQMRSHAYFHSVSLEQVLSYTREGDGNCGTRLTSGNRPPTVDAGPDRTIPRGTAFLLTAAGADPDGDPLSFCWEERDLGDQVQVTAPDDGRIPLFRSFEPTSSPSRMFPRLVDILTGVPGVGELLPATNRSLVFRVTARDNRTRGGEVASDEMTLRVHAGAGPFRVTAPTGGTLTPGPLRVTWDVARTNLAPIRTGFVNILFSTDAGQSFQPLAMNTPNDGAETVTLPATASPAGRIKIESADNVYFAMSRGFRIQPALARQARRAP